MVNNICNAPTTHPHFQWRSQYKTSKALTVCIEGKQFGGTFNRITWAAVRCGTCG